jgi:hypothetical protein
MLTGKGLLVSLPATELNGFAPSGSLFGVEELAGATLSDDLRAALELAVEACAKRRDRVVLATRPEMFTHGASLAWLQAKLGGIQDHLMLSDGRAVKPVAAMRNHLFLYRHASARSRGAFARLASQVPELIATLDSQVNTTVSVRIGAKRVAPPAWLLQSRPRPDERGAVRWYSYLNEASVDASLERMLEAAAQATPKPKPLRRLSYVPLTESAVRDPATLRYVATLIRQACAQSGSCVLLGAPRIEGASAGDAAALKAAIEFARAATPKSAKSPLPVAFVTEAPTRDLFSDWSLATNLVMPESFAYWRHAPDYYAGFKKIAVFGATAKLDRPPFLKLLTEAFGRRLAWL